MFGRTFVLKQEILVIYGLVFHFHPDLNPTKLPAEVLFSSRSATKENICVIFHLTHTKSPAVPNNCFK